VCKFISTKHTSTLHAILECSNDQDNADGNAWWQWPIPSPVWFLSIPFFSCECRNDDASGEAIGSNNNVIRRNGSSESHAHGVVQAVIHSKVASQGTAVANVHNADMVMA
jgi:hypothetical protein